MRIAFIARSTLYEVHGGITVQVMETARHLRELGVDITVHLSDDKIDYASFDLLHFFDITRPANILYHIRKSGKPFVLSPVLIDYSEYDKQHRKGISGRVFRLFSADANEYIKAVSKWIMGKDKLPSRNYLWKGHRASINEILKSVSLLLPNSAKEYEQLKKVYATKKSYAIIPNGIDHQLFQLDRVVAKDEQLIVCAARIEGLKNQLNLVKAVRDTPFRLLLIGDAAPNQQSYYQRCRDAAGSNTIFLGRVTQEELKEYYRKAKVHVLPSWFETCGLSSLEAGAMGCNIVVSDKGFTREYFGDHAFYCDPGDVDSISRAIIKAAESPVVQKLQTSIAEQYTWRHAALETLRAYRKIIPAQQLSANQHLN
jgi:glycosyltransferase involved in cell wall biosynthesis